MKKRPDSVLLLVLAACGAPHRPPPPPEFFKPPDIPASDPRAVQLRGRVVDPSGKPLANVPVLVIAGGHTGERPRTNAAGEFQISGLPPTLDGYVAVHVAGYAALVREPVRVVERNPDSVTLRLEPERVIEGVVTGPDGEPLARAVVEARGDRRLKTPIRKGATWEEVLQLDTVRADEHGHYRLAGLYVGEFELTASWPGARGVVATTKVERVAREASLRIDPKEHEQVLFVGRVVAARTKTPLVGAEVSVSWELEPSSETSQDVTPGAVLETTTDATGAFVLGPAPAALFHLAASYDVPGANHTALWRQAGAHEAGLHRLEIALDLDAR